MKQNKILYLDESFFETIEKIKEDSSLFFTLTDSEKASILKFFTSVIHFPSKAENEEFSNKNDSDLKRLENNLAIFLNYSDDEQENYAKELEKYFLENKHFYKLFEDRFTFYLNSEEFKFQFLSLIQLFFNRDIRERIYLNLWKISLAELDIAKKHGKDIYDVIQIIRYDDNIMAEEYRLLLMAQHNINL